MLPNKLKVGDTIGIISPSAPVTEDLTERFNYGLQIFKDMGLKVVLSKNVYSNTLGYSATIDETDSKINLLKQHKVFGKIKGLWLGYYEKDTETSKFEDVIINNLKEYTFPILKCNDFGHNCENVVMPIGAKVKLDATKCEVEILG